MTAPVASDAIARRGNRYTWRCDMPCGHDIIVYADGRDPPRNAECYRCAKPSGWLQPDLFDAQPDLFAAREVTP